jgi:hypothetical protein
MDKRCDYVQKFLAEWEAQNKLFEALKTHHCTFVTNLLNRKEDDLDLPRLSNRSKKTSNTTG